MRSTVRLIVALVLTCAVSALALSVIFGLTEEPIEEQKRLAVMRAVQEIRPRRPGRSSWRRMRSEPRTR
jgi:Na+-translocating ferredoxin:NAD+ oxidoreductase RnfG subunit